MANRKIMRINAKLNGATNAETFDLAGDVGSAILYGKNLVYGDSTSMIESNYWNVLISDYGIDIDNRAVYGSTAIQSALADIQAMTDDELSAYDNVVIAYGTNYWQGNIDLPTTVSEYETIYDTIFEKAPTINIIAITPFWSFRDFSITDSASTTEKCRNLRGMLLKDYVEAIKEVSSRYGVPVIDFYEQSGCNEHNYTALLDPSISEPTVYVHENAFFAKRLAQIIINASHAPYVYCPNMENYFDCLSFGGFLLLMGQVGNIGDPKYRGGLSFLFPSGVTSNSEMLYLPGGLMRLKGWTSADFNIELRNYTDATVVNTYKIKAGLFNIAMTVPLTGAYRIRIIATSDTYIGDLVLYSVENVTGLKGLYRRGYGYSPKTSLISSVWTPHLYAEGYTVYTSETYFNTVAALSEGDVIYETDSHAVPVGFCVAANRYDSQSVGLNLFQYTTNQIKFVQGPAGIPASRGIRILGTSQLLRAW